MAASTQVLPLIRDSRDKSTALATIATSEARHDTLTERTISRALEACWLQRYAAIRCNVIPPLAAYPMHNYPATRYTPISLRESA